MPPPPQKPAIVFLPCAWHTPAYYTPVCTALSAHGYETTAISLPSLNPSSSKTMYDFSEDVKAIRDAVSTLVDEEGKDVVLVCHSYSGLPGPEALRGMGKLERLKGSGSGEERAGVVRLVFVMAIMLPEGKGTAPYGDESVIPPHVVYDKEQNLVTPNPALAADIFYHDLPASEAAQWAQALQPHSAGVFWSVPTYAAWRYIPTTYVFCERDRSFPMAYVGPMVEACREARPSMLDRVERVEAGHFPFLSRVRDVVRILRGAAGEEEVGEGGDGGL